MRNLFAYGTLMCAELLWTMSACRRHPTSAVLKGYSRRCIRNAGYPGLRRDPSGWVEGVLYRDLPAAAWDRLDRFEGELYMRRQVRVRIAGGRSLAARVYVTKPRYLGRLGQTDWDVGSPVPKRDARFRRRELQRRMIGATAPRVADEG